MMDACLTIKESTDDLPMGFDHKHQYASYRVPAFESTISFNILS